MFFSFQRRASRLSFCRHTAALTSFPSWRSILLFLCSYSLQLGGSHTQDNYINLLIGKHKKMALEQVQH